MRESPSLDAKVIALLPVNSEVLVLEEIGEPIDIGGKKGRWTKVSYQATSGWVFGGFLSAQSLAENLSTEQLFKNFASYKLASFGGYVQPTNCGVAAFGSTDCSITKIEFFPDKAVIYVHETAISDDPKPSSHEVTWQCYVSRKLLVAEYGKPVLTSASGEGFRWVRCAAPGSGDFPPHIE